MKMILLRCPPSVRTAAGGVPAALFRGHLASMALLSSVLQELCVVPAPQVTGKHPQCSQRGKVQAVHNACPSSSSPSCLLLW